MIPAPEVYLKGKARENPKHNHDLIRFKRPGIYALRPPTQGILLGPSMPRGKAGISTGRFLSRVSPGP